MFSTLFRRHRRKVTGTALLAAFAALAVGLWPEHESRASRNEAFRYPVQAIELHRDTVRPELELTGKVEPGRKRSLVAHFDGWVSEVDVVVGQQVSKGTRLLALDRRFITDALAEARLALDDNDVARKELDQREKYLKQRLAIEQGVLERLKLVKESAAQLRERAVITVMDYEQHLSAVDTRRLQVLDLQRELEQMPLERRRLGNEAAKLGARVTQLQGDYDAAELLAPFDAVVLDIGAAPGTRVAAGTALLTLASTDALQVTVPWPMEIGPSQRVDAYAVLGDRQVPLQVAEVGAVIEAGRSTPQAVLTAADSESRQLVLGAFVPVRLELAPVPDAFVVPEGSLYAGDRVFRIDATGGRLDGVGVRIGGHRYLPDGSLQWIVSAPGLVDGDRLLTTRLAAAADGLPVEVALVGPSDRSADSDDAGARPQ